MDVKPCCLCKTSKPLSEFNRKSSSPDGLQSVCRTCNKARSRQYYAENTEKHKAVIYARQIRQTAVLRTYVWKLKQQPCTDCNTTYHPFVMDFDHVRGVKHRDISKLVQAASSWKMLKDEIAKCDLVCSNCHRTRTWFRLSNQGELEVSAL